MNMVDCNREKCRLWDSDKDGGHCMAFVPPCYVENTYNKVAYYRKQAKMTQDDLACCVGITRQALSQIENGNNPRVTVALKICAVLDKSISEVFFLDGECGKEC